MSEIAEYMRQGGPCIELNERCKVMDAASGCACAKAAAEIERLMAALEVCDRVLHFDLRGMITWGKDYNQAVKDAADAARAALGERT